MLSGEREVKKLRSSSTSSGLRGRMVIAAPSMRAASALQVSEIGGGVEVSVVTVPAYGNRRLDVVGRWSPRRWASASGWASPFRCASTARRNPIPPSLPAATGSAGESPHHRRLESQGARTGRNGQAFGTRGSQGPRSEHPCAVTLWTRGKGHYSGGARWPGWIRACWAAVTRVPIGGGPVALPAPGPEGDHRLARPPRREPQ